MIGTLGLLETTGLTPAMVAIDSMLKAADVRLFQLELNDLSGVCVKMTGRLDAVHAAISVGRAVAQQMRGQPVTSVLSQVLPSVSAVLRSQAEFSPLIQQAVVFQPEENAPTESTAGPVDQSASIAMNQETPMALGFIETQGFTAVFEAIDTACKAASVEVVGKEKLGGGYVTIVIQGQLSAVSAAVDAGKQKVDGLGKLIAAHVIARPSEAVLKLLPRL
jgi:microcompartment protein CcmL/EutN